MIISIIALSIPVIISILSLVTGKDKRKTVKAILIFLTLGGLGLGIFSAIDENTAKQKSIEKQTSEESLRKQSDSILRITNTTLNKTQDSLREDRIKLILINSRIDELTSLNKLSGNSRYYVVISSAKNEKELTKAKEGLEHMFTAAKENGHVIIKQNKSGWYELIFGNNLSLTEAENYLELAMNHNFANGNARIVRIK